VFAAFVALFGLGTIVKGGKRLKAIWGEEELKLIDRRIEEKRKGLKEAIAREDLETAKKLESEIKELEEKKRKILQP
jgi:protein-arginine kinase activator protein McsA